MLIVSTSNEEAAQTKKGRKSNKVEIVDLSGTLIMLAKP